MDCGSKGLWNCWGALWASSPPPGGTTTACRRQPGVSGQRERTGELIFRSRGLDAEGLNLALAGSSKAAFLCEKP